MGGMTPGEARWGPPMRTSRTARGRRRSPACAWMPGWTGDPWLATRRSRLAVLAGASERQES